MSRSALVLTLLALAAFLISTGEQDTRGTETRGGNRAPSDEWKIDNNALHGEVGGYTATTSVKPGSPLDFYIRSATPRVDLAVYRMGWYDGKGGTRVYVRRGLSARSEPIPDADPETGLVEPAWPRTLRLHIPTTWESGMYLAKLTNEEGYERFVPFVVKDSTPQPILLVHSVLTDQAYNQWGGNSLYRGKTSNLGISRAVNVSLQRPFEEGDGAGFFFQWEYPMVRFLERHGYRVSYATDVDIHENPGLLSRYRLVLLVGHDEYWTKEMRDGYERAVAGGVNLAVFGGNTGYRQVRLESSSKTRTKHSILVHYRDAFQHDPLLNKDPGRVTVEWRHPLIARPESKLLGATFGEQLPSSQTFPLVITNPDHWIFTGTNARSGDTIPDILAYEIDTLPPESRTPTVDVLTQSPVPTKKGYESVATATLTSHPGGGRVFNAGATHWATGLDETLLPRIAHPILQRITRNILDELARQPVGKTPVPVWQQILQQRILRFSR